MAHGNNQKQVPVKKRIGIFIFDAAEVLDFAGPFEVFSVASEVHNHSLYEVVTIAKQEDIVTAVNGLLISPHYSIENAPPLDILIVAGGAGTRNVMADERVLKWVRSIHEKAELTMSICSGARLLGALGLLDNKPYCTHHGVYDHMAEVSPSGIPRKDKRFIQTDKNLFTSGGISAGIDLSFYVLEMLNGKQVVEATAAYMEYDVREKYRYGVYEAF
jgi:transcriptional regulator GlxA family with amidase domain